jgi:hypothetical protein
LPTAIDRRPKRASRRRSWGSALRSVAPARDSSRRRPSRDPHVPLGKTGRLERVFIEGPAERDGWIWAPKRPTRLRCRLPGGRFGPQPYDIHHRVLAGQGRSPRLLGLIATGNPCPAIRDRAGRDCLGLCLWHSFNVRRPRVPPEHRAVPEVPSPSATDCRPFTRLRRLIFQAIPSLRSGFGSPGAQTRGSG